MPAGEVRQKLDAAGFTGRAHLHDQQRRPASRPVVMMVNSFLSELGKRLAERWFSVLVLPGALYLALAVVAHTLGHNRPFDLPFLIDRITAWASTPAAGTLGGQIMSLVAVLAGSAAVGLVARSLSALVERATLAADWRDWPSPLRRYVSRLVRRRQESWTTRAAAWHQLRRDALDGAVRGERTDSSERHAAYRAMSRISAERPDRPTWCGDRLHAAAIRLERDFHLQLDVVWPHVWLILPDSARSEITAAGQGINRATARTAWAVLCLVLALVWWPAAAVAAVLFLSGHRGCRAATDLYALLLESAAQLHIRDLAERLGLDGTGTPEETGERVTRMLEGTLPPPP
ncbi:hypothetical protein ACFWP3_20935 [Streptomyces sp. NPDC058525]|uniref:hypothetical protein n=1 Tax=Streptomyces sp. NPDC058525 TaxID=3346538 RepID=UPI0036674C67